MVNFKAIILKIFNKMLTIWWGKQDAAPLNFDRKPSEVAFIDRFSNFVKCRLEISDDVISGVLVNLVGTHVYATCDGSESELNSG